MKIKCCRKQKKDIMMAEEKKLLNTVGIIKIFWKKRQEISSETYVRKKKNQKDFMEEMDTETWQNSFINFIHLFIPSPRKVKYWFFFNLKKP